MTGEDKPLKRPESVLVLVFTVLCQVLVMRRCRPADFWQSVTGSMQWDEDDPLETARRELFEETGLADVDIIDCHTVNRFPIKPAWQARYGDARENTEHVFRTELPRCVAIRVNPEEHSEYCWLPRQAAAAKVSSWTNRDAILRFVPPLEKTLP